VAPEIASRLPEAPAVAAVLVHYGAQDPTLACLGDLEAVDYPGLRVLLVDNGPDGALSWSPRPPARLLSPGRNLGYCAGVNLGLAEALAGGADYVRLLNNDVRLAPGFLTPLVEALEADPTAGSAGPLVLDPDGRIWAAGGNFAFGPSVTRLRGHGRRPGKVHGFPRAVDYHTGACVLPRAEALAAAGPLDEDYWMYMEALALALKMRAKGYRALYIPWSRVVHAPSTSTGGGISAARKRLTAHNSVRFLRKWGTPRRWLAFWLCDVALLPLAALLWVARGQGLAPALAKARGLWDGLRGLPAGPAEAP